MDNDNRTSKTPQVMRNIFGVVMIIVYIGVGLLFLFGFFNPIIGSWTWLRWAGGILFIVYGIWRAYTQFKGIDPDITTRY